MLFAFEAIKNLPALAGGRFKYQTGRWLIEKFLSIVKLHVAQKRYYLIISYKYTIIRLKIWLLTIQFLLLELVMRFGLTHKFILMWRSQWCSIFLLVTHYIEVCSIHGYCHRTRHETIVFSELHDFILFQTGFRYQMQGWTITHSENS